MLRGDSGFCREELMAWCEAEGVAYLFGLAPNARLKAVLAPEAWEAARLCRTTGKAARLFRDFAYQTETSWSRPRRVVGKAEHLPDGANPRFVVTSLGREKIDARGLYEDLYCARGEMENRIKECQLDLFADRTSSATMQANQLRLWFTGALDDILCIHEERTVSNDNTVRYKRLALQIPAGRHRHHYVKARVRVHEYPDGTMAVFHGPRCLARYHADGQPIDSQTREAA